MSHPGFDPPGATGSEPDNPAEPDQSAARPDYSAPSMPPEQVHVPVTMPPPTAPPPPASWAPPAPDPPTPAPGFPASSAAVPVAPTYDPNAYPNQPYSAQPYPAQPYPAQPYSAQPYSAQPYAGQPYSAPPASGTYGYQTMAAPQPKRGRAGTVVLSILTALFLVAAGVFGALFFMRNSEANRLQSQVSQLSGDKNGLQRDLENTKRDLTDAKADAEEITKARDALADCIKAIIALGDVDDQNTAEARTKQADVNTKCNAAEKYLP